MSDRYVAASTSKPLLSAVELHRLLVDWNATAVEYRADCSVAELVSEQADATPAALALEDDRLALSFRELDARSSQLANYLVRHFGVGRDAIVALFLERSIESIIAILGILKAGAAYLPLSPSHPLERNAYMLSDARPRAILAQATSTALLPETSAPIILLDGDCQSIASEPMSAPAIHVEACDLAYVVYTSGSTGKPKGVMIPHRALTNHMLWMRDRFPLQSDDVMLLKTPLVFDASVWEIFAPLIAGAKVVVARPGGHKDPAYLSAAIRTHGVTTLQLVPSMLRLFLRERTVGECQSLRNVFSGGEVLTTTLRDEFFLRLPAQLHNLYGPTETCIQCIVYSCKRNGPRESTVPIGRPISNTCAYILDEKLEPVQVGEQGELYIGGAGVARGYLGRDDLTHERFVRNPFTNLPGTLYRTGDLARYLSDGNIEYLGRVDDQIKVAGCRIEPAEIEAALSSHPSVSESIVTAASDAFGNAYLIAHVVPARDTQPESAALRRHLTKAGLTASSIPTTFRVISEIPRLQSGKVDRQFLSSRAPQGEGEREPASMSHAQFAMLETWAEILELKHVDMDDDFFDLGGSSLMLILSFTLLNERLGTSVELEVLSQAATTIRGLSPYFDAARRDSGQSNSCSKRSDVCLL